MTVKWLLRNVDFLQLNNACYYIKLSASYSLTELIVQSVQTVSVYASHCLSVCMCLGSENGSLTARRKTCGTYAD